MTSTSTEEKIRDYLRQGLPKTEMVKRLRNDEDVPEFGVSKLESDRTKLYRFLDTIRLRDKSGVWCFGDNDYCSAVRDVLDVLAYVVEETNDRISYLTNDEADWIIRIRAASPDIPVSELWQLTRWYILYSENERDTFPLDKLLAFQPWRSPEDEARSARYAKHWINRIRNGRETVSAGELADVAPFVRRRWRAENSRALVMWQTLVRGGHVRVKDNSNDE